MATFFIYVCILFCKRRYISGGWDKQGIGMARNKQSISLLAFLFLQAMYRNSVAFHSKKKKRIVLPALHHSRLYRPIISTEGQSLKHNHERLVGNLYLYLYLYLLLQQLRFPPKFLVWYFGLVRLCYWQVGISQSHMRVGRTRSVHDLIT